MSVPRSVIDRCDAVLTQADADLPVITPFLPVTGLRHDENGKLSADSIKTILDGMKSMGIVIDTEEKQYGFIQEAKYILCKLNSQYEFMLNDLLSSISRSEKVDPELISKLQTKNQNMQDVLSVSRHILEMDLKEMKEGFMSSSPSSTIMEEFQTMAANLQAESATLKAEKYDDIRRHSIEISGDAARYASRFMEIFGFLNITAFGILLYIVSVN
jgi:hypothetical protein